MNKYYSQIPIQYYYLGSGIGLIALSLLPTSWWLQALLVWCGLSLLVVVSAYLFNSAKIFRKREDGSIPAFIRWLFLPFLLGTTLYNIRARKKDIVPAMQKVGDKLFLGCRLAVTDIPDLKQQRIGAVLDVTAEFDALDWSLVDEGVEYLNIPVLDHQAPSFSQLTQAINWIHQQRHKERNVLIHCALGRGRSVLVTAAYLLAKDQQKSVRDALTELNSVRSTARLNQRQLTALSKARNDDILRLSRQVWIIANPVSGSKKWDEHKLTIIEMLKPHFSLNFLFTEQQTSGTTLANQALKQGADLIIAAGGDGTVTEVADAVRHTNIPMGIIPLGTTNALAHVLLGVESKVFPIARSCEAIIQGHKRQIDTATCNNQLVLLLVGLGFEQRMIESADRQQKNQLGQLAYVQGLLTAIESNEKHEVQLQIDDKPQQQLTFNSLVVANSAPFTTVLAQGKGEPDIDDGLLDITWIEHSEAVSERFLSLAELALAATSQIAISQNTQHLHAKSVKISAPRPFKYVIDGELFEATSIDIDIQPAALTIYYPT